MELLGRAHALEAQGRDIIHMEVGEPDFACPQPILAAAQHYLSSGQVRYTSAIGLPALREALSDFYLRRFNAKVPAERIIITSGASGALLLAIAALTNPGDEWLLTGPGYPCNRQFIQAFNGIVKALPVEAQHKFQPTAPQISSAWSERTRGLMIASPANPTGTLIDESELDQIAEAVEAQNGKLIVDEIYQGLVYGRPASSILQRNQNVFVVNSFSKYFGMTGWRLGWLVVPDGYSRPIEMLAQHLFIAPSSPAQYAALAAFSDDTQEILEARRSVFDARRKILLSGLKSLGAHVETEPTGAFYAYANISTLSSNSTDFARALLERAGVATTPGVDFGNHLSHHYLRIAYTADTARIEEAIERIGSIL